LIVAGSIPERAPTGPVRTSNTGRLHAVMDTEKCAAGLRVSAAENVQNYGVAELVISAKWRAPSPDRLIRALVASIVQGISKK
jgi:hypothetical protein